MLATLDTPEGTLSTLPTPDTDDLTDTPTLKAALEGPERDKWMSAIHAELQNIKAEDV